MWLLKQNEKLKKIEKKKMSFDLNEDNVIGFNNYKNKLFYKKSTTDILNDLINILICSDISFKRELASFALEKINFTETEDHSDDTQNTNAETYRKLYEILKGNGDLGFKNVKRVDFYNGYVIVPDDWINITSGDLMDPSQQYPHLIEFTHNDLNLPHFFFFHELPYIHSEEYFLKRASEFYEPLKDIIPQIVYPIWDKNGIMLNTEEWLKSPFPGFFKFPTPTSYRKSVMDEFWVPKKLIDEEY